MGMTVLRSEVRHRRTGVEISKFARWFGWTRLRAWDKMGQNSSAREFGMCKDVQVFGAEPKIRPNLCLANTEVINQNYQGVIYQHPTLERRTNANPDYVLAPRPRRPAPGGMPATVYLPIQPAED